MQVMKDRSLLYLVINKQVKVTRNIKKQIRICYAIARSYTHLLTNYVKPIKI